MIGKGKSIMHTRNAINYISTRDLAEELDRNLIIGESPEEISNEFDIFQKLNSRCTNNSFSFVISPDIDDGRKITQTDHRDIVRDFLKRMDLDSHQYIAYLHKEKQHKHIHIVVNRVDQQGIAYKDNFIGKRSQDAAEQIARTRNMVVARDVQQKNEQILKERISLEHSRVMQRQPRDIHDYADLMEKRGVKTHLKKANNGQVVGIRFQVGNKYIKASQVNRMLSALNLQQTLVEIARTVVKQMVRSMVVGI